MLEIAMWFFMHFYEHGLHEGRHFPEQGQTGAEVIPLKRITLIRTMSTVVGLIFAMTTFDREIPLDRISTHPLENFFGLLRRLLHDCNRFDEVLHGAAKNAIVNRVYHEQGHPVEICGRANVAGIVNATGDKPETAPTFTSQQAYEQIMTAFEISQFPDRQLDDVAILQIEEVFDWLQLLNRETMTAHIETGRHFVIRATANSKIMASLLQRRRMEMAAE